MTDQPRRDKAIAEWQKVKERAYAMNETSRIPKRPLTGLSAAEIEDMAWTLNRTLDQVAWGYVWHDDKRVNNQENR